MGKYNSSTYRVTPFLDFIRGDLERINTFLSIFGIRIASLPLEYFYGENEKTLKPTKQHLTNIVVHFSGTEGVKVPTMTEDRKALLLGDAVTRKDKADEAIRLLNESYAVITPDSKDWFIFEGFTHPDIFVLGEDYVLIGEGKWTEPHITTKTSNLNYRNQMARHIQAALNAYPGKRIISFYLVDAGCGYLSDLTNDAFKKQLDEETIPIPEKEKEAIANCFAGYATWQEIGKLFPEIRFLSKAEIDSLC